MCCVFFQAENMSKAFCRQIPFCVSFVVAYSLTLQSALISILDMPTE